MLCIRYRRLATQVLQRNVRFYAYDPNSSGIRKVKQFEPSVAEAGKASIKSETKDIHAISMKNAQAAQAKAKKDEVRTRRLYIWDKWILVKLGKYQKIGDVPDEIRYSLSKVEKQDEERIKAEVTEKIFKYGLGFDYLMWVATFVLGGSAYYIYFVLRPQDKLLNSDQSKSDATTTSQK